MEYRRIVAVTGMPGLYEVVSSKTDGAVVRSLEDQTTKFVSSRVHNLSHLESIEIYTAKENVTLADVFMAMKASAVPLPDEKDSNGIKKYFGKVYPDMDFERVYSSDMKKMIKWYQVLLANKIDFTPQPDAGESPDENTVEPQAEEAVPAEKPKRGRKKKTGE